MFCIANLRRVGQLQALPIDIDQITMGDDLSTNYQVLPGDRLVVPRKTDSGPTCDAAESPSKSRRQPVAFRSISIVRRPTQSSRPSSPVRLRSHRPRSSPLLRMEARLNDVERKLDVILEALEAARPDIGPHQVRPRHRPARPYPPRPGARYISDVGAMAFRIAIVA